MFEEFLNGRKPTPALAQEWLQELLTRGKKPTAVARHGHCLRRFFDYLGVRGAILLPSGGRHGVPEYLEREEIEKLLKASKTPTEKVLVTMLCDTGLRISEFLALTKKDIDWEGGFVFAHREKTKNDSWIPVSQLSLKALKEYLEWRHGKDDKLFPYDYRQVWEWLRKLGERAKLGKRIHPHMFRHTAAALRRIEGQEIEDLKDLLGHANINTTMIYASLKPRALKERIKPIW
jgi:site-specific recombinase XerD